MKKAVLFIFTFVNSLFISLNARYDYLSQLGKDSVLYSECMNTQEAWFVKGDVENACDELEDILKKFAPTGKEYDGYNVSEYIRSLATKKEAMATILAKHDDAVKLTEKIRIQNFAGVVDR